jgi:two-component system cell cycle response regulator
MGAWILVADGDAEVRMELFRLLEADGYHVTVVHSGERALELLRSEPFDLALVDVTGQGLDGVALLQEMRADPNLDHLPLLITFPIADATKVTRYLETGAQDYLPKPFDPRLVRSRVRATLAEKQLQNLRAEYERQIRQVTDAVAGIPGSGYDPAALEQMSRQSSPCGRLAVAVLKMAGRVKAREQLQSDGDAFGTPGSGAADGSSKSKSTS